MLVYATWGQNWGWKGTRNSLPTTGGVQRLVIARWVVGGVGAPRQCAKKKQ